MPLSDNEKLILAAGVGVGVGALFMGMAAQQQRQRQQYQAGVQAMQQQQQQTPLLTPVSSTGSLNNGWIYYVTVGMPGVDLTQAANQATAAAALVAAGFVDPTTKSTPTFTPGLANQATALTVFTGPQGTSLPASTATFQYVSVLGQPAPEVLSI
jgi:hypothetical protein